MRNAGAAQGAVLGPTPHEQLFFACVLVAMVLCVCRQLGCVL